MTNTVERKSVDATILFAVLHVCFMGGGGCGECLTSTSPTRPKQSERLSRFSPLDFMCHLWKREVMVGG
ncbi:hypothetical protein BaRGS_00014545 [Batillaria attramentaria]|uniref:Secreted protein n=1 Tax=Batillaria attramentaria TaxID=370345 RepID=A0ABD0L4N0_9CAEN